MTTAPPLHPLGAARVRFLAAHAATTTTDPPREGFPPPRGAVRFVSKLLVERARELGAEEALACGVELASLPGLPDNDRESLLWLATALFFARTLGGTRLALDGDGPEALRGLLGLLGATSADSDAVRRFLDASGQGGLVGGADAGRPIVLQSGALSLHADDVAERRLARLLAQRRANASSLDAPTRTSALAAASARQQPLLDADQHAAVALALEGQLTVVSGGPGTGKTTIVLAILRAWVAAGADPAALLLAAPTGKAAHRVAESIRQQLVPSDPTDARLLAELPAPATLHRMLGFSPSTGRFRHHPGNPVSARVVLVDEASMVDLQLADHLLRALAPETALVLLGDAHQLPSVDSGAVLRDLVSAAQPQGTRTGVARLTRSHRMRADDPNGSHILRFANAVNAADLDALAPATNRRAEAREPELRRFAREVEFEGVEQLAASERKELQFRWFQRVRPPGLAPLWERTWSVETGRIAAADALVLSPLLRLAERGKVLCALRDRASGSGMADWNTAIRERMAALLGQRRADGFLPAEPAIATHNDYDRGLFNGDVGLVLNASFDGHPARLAFVLERPEGLRAFPLDAVRNSLEPAWALTIHRAQGSEFEEVIVALPSIDTPLWTRELLYTATTRAKRGVLLVGDAERVVAAARTPVSRRTALAELLSTT